MTKDFYYLYESSDGELSTNPSANWKYRVLWYVIDDELHHCSIRSREGAFALLPLNWIMA
jgi:hypothetical protein